LPSIAQACRKRKARVQFPLSLRLLVLQLRLEHGPVLPHAIFRFRSNFATCTFSPLFKDHCNRKPRLEVLTNGAKDFRWCLNILAVRVVSALCSISTRSSPRKSHSHLLYRKNILDRLGDQSTTCTTCFGVIQADAISILASKVCERIISNGLDLAYLGIMYLFSCLKIGKAEQADLQTRDVQDLEFQPACRRGKYKDITMNACCQLHLATLSRSKYCALPVASSTNISSHGGAHLLRTLDQLGTWSNHRRYIDLR